MEYDDPQDGRELAERVRAFVEEEVIPVERDLLGEGSVSADEMAALREMARERDVYAPQVEEESGGLGYDLRAVLPAFEAAGRSLLGPAAIRVDAPDEGNMHTLEMFGTEDQKERWLRPLVAGDVVSAFAMTEPMQGAGSDPKMLATTAEKEGDEYVIDGHKWWTSNGSQADVFLTMARTDQDAHPYQGASIILVPRDADGLEIVRDVPHVGGAVTGSSHAEVRFDGVRVPEENLLGAENAGFAISQQRLGPARLTHCMRFSGMADRALTIGKTYASERQAFGEPVAEKDSMRHRVADVEARLHAVRTTVRHAAAALARGEEARVEVSMSKLLAANVVQDAVDLSVQLCGGNGIGKDLPLADFYENVRAFRIFDGADEVHRRVIARDAFEDLDEDELAPVTRFQG
jgi:acyl-CoA dehydrogenase